MDSVEVKIFPKIGKEEELVSSLYLYTPMVFNHKIGIYLLTNIYICVE